MIDICPGVAVSEHELRFSFDRSPGPGGQNVNKVNTRVTLHFDVSGSTSLSTLQKNLIAESLSSRIAQDGVLRIHSSKERTQLANRRAAVGRFIELVSAAFSRPKPRKATVVPASSQRKRLEEKNHRAGIKQVRQQRVALEE
jgi:ribosome-associated protein